MRLRRLRGDKRNRLAAPAPVDFEIIQIRGDDGIFRIEFAHADEADISEIRRAIRIAGGQLGEAGKLSGEIESGPHQAIVDERQSYCGASEVERGLGEYGFAG